MTRGQSFMHPKVYYTIAIGSIYAISAFALFVVSSVVSLAAVAPISSFGFTPTFTVQVFAGASGIALLFVVDFYRNQVLYNLDKSKWGYQ